VAKDGAQFAAARMIAEGRGLRARERGGEPLHIILHENLHGGAADGKGAVDGHGTSARG
jgi:hypothetical protein